MSGKHLELFSRHKINPILTAADWPYPVNSVFNPGVACCLIGQRFFCAGWKTGAADSSIALATGSVKMLLEWLEQN